MKVFVTGHKGYVGYAMTKLLLQENFEVVGCDLEYYPQNFIKNNISDVKSIKKDIRNISSKDLKGCSAIIHLAALSNDPLGEINPSLTGDINFLATIRLAKLAKEVGINKFIYSSSCSAYGVNDDTVDENSSLEPLTAYAKSKVNSELELLKMKDSEFSPVVLRNATAYGISSNLRLDLVVNNLICAALTTGKVRLLSDGTAWRPLLHIEDMSKAFITCLNATDSKVSGEIFNVGSNDDNCTVREIAEKVEQIVPNSKIEYSKNANKDSRSYKVDFSKIKQQLGFKTKWNLEKAIKEIYDLLKFKEFTEEDFKNEKYFRVAYIKSLIEKGEINNNLFFQ